MVRFGKAIVDFFVGVEIRGNSRGSRLPSYMLISEVMARGQLRWPRRACDRFTSETLQVWTGRCPLLRGVFMAPKDSAASAAESAPARSPIARPRG